MLTPDESTPVYGGGCPWGGLIYIILLWMDKMSPVRRFLFISFFMGFHVFSDATRMKSAVCLHVSLRGFFGCLVGPKVVASLVSRVCFRGTLVPSQVVSRVVSLVPSWTRHCELEFTAL